MSRRGEGRSQQTYSLPGKPVSLLASVCWWGGGGGGWQTCITAGLCGLGRGAWQTCITAGLFGWVGGGAVGWGGVAGKPVSLLASLGGWVGGGCRLGRGGWQTCITAGLFGWVGGGAVGWGGVAGKPVSLLASVGWEGRWLQAGRGGGAGGGGGGRGGWQTCISAGLCGLGRQTAAGWGVGVGAGKPVSRLALGKVFIKYCFPVTCP